MTYNDRATFQLDFRPTSLFSSTFGIMSGQGDDLDGLTGFFFYMFIVHPMTAWILRPGRFERKKSIMYAIGFLATLAAIKTGESS